MNNPYQNEKLDDVIAIESSIESGQEGVNADVEGQPPAIDMSKWRNKPLRIGRLEMEPYASSSIQLALLGIFFLCGPGMFAALSGLGGGGLGNPTPVNNSLIATYGFNAVVGFFSGPICTKIGYRISLALGSFAFAFFSACLVIYQHTQAGWVLILGGVVLGILSSFSSTAQGAMVMTYPTPETRGKYVSLNWIYFNSGATLGSAIVFFENLHSSSSVINTATYIAYIVVMSIAIPVSLATVKANHVIRSDSSLVKPLTPSNWNSAVVKFFQRLKSDTYIVTLFPLLFASNFYLTYIFNDLNLPTFNVRTRALNVILFYAAGIPGAYLTGLVLDLSFLRRKIRVRIALLALFIFFTAIFSASYAWQRNFTRAETRRLGFELIDCSSPRYIAPLFLFLGLGFVHFVFQNCIYWFLAALADNSATADTADFAGFFKSLQAVGAASAWRVSNEELGFLTDLGISWGLVMGSMVLAAPVLIIRIKDSLKVDMDVGAKRQEVGSDCEDRGGNENGVRDEARVGGILLEGVVVPQVHAQENLG